MGGEPRARVDDFHNDSLFGASVVDPTANVVDLPANAPAAANRGDQFLGREKTPQRSFREPQGRRKLGGDGKQATEIPLKDGCFEVPLPKALFEGNPKTIMVNRIDFYRN